MQKNTKRIVFCLQTILQILLVIILLIFFLTIFLLGACLGLGTMTLVIDIFVPNMPITHLTHMNIFGAGAGAYIGTLLFDPTMDILTATYKTHLSHYRCMRWLCEF